MQRPLNQSHTTWHLLAAIAMTCLLCACGGGSDAGTGIANEPGNDSISTEIGSGPWTVRLSWSATVDPGIYGYRVYHGGAANKMTTQSGFIGGNSIELDIATAGKHYFSVVSVDAYNRESPPSDAVALTLN